MRLQAKSGIFFVQYFCSDLDPSEDWGRAYESGRFDSSVWGHFSQLCGSYNYSSFDNEVWDVHASIIIGK